MSSRPSFSQHRGQLGRLHETQYVTASPSVCIPSKRLVLELWKYFISKKKLVFLSTSLSVSFWLAPKTTFSFVKETLYTIWSIHEVSFLFSVLYLSLWKVISEELKAQKVITTKICYFFFFFWEWWFKRRLVEKSFRRKKANAASEGYCSNYYLTKQSYLTTFKDIRQSTTLKPQWLNS